MTRKQLHGGVLVLNGIFGLLDRGFAQSTITGSHPLVPGLTCTYKREGYYTDHPAIGTDLFGDLESIPASETYTQQYLDPVGLGDAASYPTANIAWETAQIPEFRVFHRVDADGAQEVGHYYIPDGTPNVALDPLRYLLYPLAFGDAWTDTLIMATVVGPDTGIYAYDVPAWGTVEIPYGQVDQVLLVRSLWLDTMWTPLGPEVDRIWEYNFRADEHHCPLAYIYIYEHVTYDGLLLNNGVIDLLESVDLTTAVSEHSSRQWWIWPVPAGEQLHVSTDKEVVARLILLDLQGRVVRDVAARTVGPAGCSLHIGDLAMGTHTLVAIDDGGMRSTHAVQVSR